MPKMWRAECLRLPGHAIRPLSVTFVQDPSYPVARNRPAPPLEICIEPFLVTTIAATLAKFFTTSRPRCPRTKRPVARASAKPPLGATTVALWHEGVRIVAGVADQRFAICLREQLFGDRHLVPLARRQRDVERAALRVDDGMELCRKTSSRAARSIAFDPPFPPEESWCARITEPSTIEPVSSSSNFSSRKIAAQWFLQAQFANRL